MSLPKETIAAYADGELDGDGLREAEVAIAADPALQEQLEAHRALKSRLSAHFAPIVEAPVPEHLVRAVKGRAAVVDFTAVVRKRTQYMLPRFAWAGPALAASLVAGLVGFGLSQRSVRDYAVGDVAAALDSQLVANQSPQAPVRILLSFRDGQGNYCRGFSSTAQSGVACRDGRGWKLGKVIESEKAKAGEYRQAGSADAAVLSAIQDMADGPALNGEGEETARRAGWQK